jgi:hypothetical protein
MRKISSFELECGKVFPECDHRCTRCVEELRFECEEMAGVTRFSTKGELGKDLVIAIEHDPAAVTVDDLKALFTRLPSFHMGSFVAKLVEKK